jgi:hypothetical protein
MNKLEESLDKIVKKRMPKKHYCLWLKPEKGRYLYCWQSGKRIKKSECTACLLARLVQSVTYLDARRKAKKPSHS